MKILENVFSIKNAGYHKVITILGLKIKYKSRARALAMISLERNKHLNRIINCLIEKSDDDQLKAAQINYLFYNVYKREYNLNLEHPKTFNEKIQWMSLNYYNKSEVIHRIVDKYQFKEYIKEKLGDGYTIPLLGKWESPYDINFKELPRQFVLKSNWGGDGMQVYIVSDKTKINEPEIIQKMSQWISFSGNPYWIGFNGPVKNINPCILAEEYIEEINLEYKFFCFNGVPKLFYVVNYKNKELTYYDMELNQLPFSNGPYKRSTITKHKPSVHFNKMINIAKKLSEPFPFVRVDFYSLKEKFYIGEMTFTPTGGLGKYDPVEWDYKLGEMLDITNIKEAENA